MPAAAIPIMMAASTAVSAYSAHEANKAGKLSPTEQAAQRTQLGASNALSQQGQQLTGYGMPKLQQAGNYFTGMAAGDRSKVQQTLAPEVSNINDVYGGTQRTLTRFLRGPDRDYQVGELTRQRGGAIGSLFAGARQKGIEGLTSLGQYGVNQGQSALGGAAGIAGTVGAAGMQNRYAGAELKRQAGSDTAGLIFQLLKMYGAGGGGGGGTSMMGNAAASATPFIG